MSRLHAVRRFIFPLAIALVATLVFVWPSVRARAGQEAQPQQQNQQNQQGQGQEQKQEKKKGGFFEGMKAITGSSSEQTSATASAGTKGVGEGAKIGEVTPTAADRQAVTDMERYFLPPQEVKKFDEQGNLKPRP